MNKRKILSLAMALSIIAIMAVGATLAYFTDTDRATNTFSIGNLDIKVMENDADTDGIDFEKLMPGDVITKKAEIKNDSNVPAYVRIVVHMNNQEELYKKIAAYDKQENPMRNADEIFTGWDFTFQKAEDGMTYTSTRTENATADGVTLLKVDEAIHSNGGGNALMSNDNWFKTETEENSKENGTGRFIVSTSKSVADIYYKDLVGTYKESAVAWIYYLKMEPQTSYKLFDGITIPEDFGTDEMSFFENLRINVCADAIQTTGFEGTSEEEVAKKAFEALNTEHPLSSWNLGNR